MPKNTAKGGGWVTINGVHVLIENGKVTKGPAKFIGSSVNDLPSGQSAEDKKAALKAKYANKSGSSKQEPSASGSSKSASERPTTMGDYWRQQSKLTGRTEPLKRGASARKSTEKAEEAKKATAKKEPLADRYKPARHDRITVADKVDQNNVKPSKGNFKPQSANHSTDKLGNLTQEIFPKAKGRAPRTEQGKKGAAEKIANAYREGKITASEAKSISQRVIGYKATEKYLDASLSGSLKSIVNRKRAEQRAGAEWRGENKRARELAKEGKAPYSRFDHGGARNVTDSEKRAVMSDREMKATYIKAKDEGWSDASAVGFAIEQKANTVFNMAIDRQGYVYSTPKPALAKQFGSDIKKLAQANGGFDNLMANSNVSDKAKFAMQNKIKDLNIKFDDAINGALNKK